MKLGIISDTHDRLESLGKAAKLSFLVDFPASDIINWL